MSYYDDLGVDRDATPDEIKAAWRRVARIWHPDTNPNDPQAEALFKAAAAAWEVLRDPERRAEYDRTGETNVERKLQLKAEARLMEVFVAIANRRGWRDHHYIAEMRAHIGAGIDEWTAEVGEKSDLMDAIASSHGYPSRRGPDDQIVSWDADDETEHSFVALALRRKLDALDEEIKSLNLEIDTATRALEILKGFRDGRMAVDDLLTSAGFRSSSTGGPTSTWP